MSALLSSLSGAIDTALGRVRLPVSGREVQIHAPSGVEDLLLVEETGSALEVSLSLLRRLVHSRDDAAGDIAHLPLHDLDVLLLRLRRALLGDRIATDSACQGPACGARMDISFGIEDYLNHHRPLPKPYAGRPWLVTVAEESWFHLKRRRDGREVALFRLPTAQDLLETQENGAEGLIERCIRPSSLPAGEMRLVDAAMEAISPSLASDLNGTCPDCATAMRVAFEPRSYCIAEFRQRARFVIEEIGLLAERYHWSEREILALPNRRRVAYAEQARQSLGAL